MKTSSPGLVRGSAARRARRGAPIAVLVACVAALFVLVLASVAIGSNPLSLGEAWRGLVHVDDSRASIIVWQLRMPRTALAILVGVALAVAGVMMQALTRNPLAEPGLLGVNAGAAFAVVMGISFLGITSTSILVWFALAGAGAAAGFVYVISVRRSRPGDHARLVLAGAALSASLAACTGVITMFDTDAFSSYRFWVIGSVADRGLEPLFAVLPLIITGLVAAAITAPALNALALGDEQATALGVPLPLVRVLAFASIALLCGAATAVAGPIAFVGLVVPHALRLLLGVDQRVVLAFSILAGPILVLGSDIVGRVVARPGELEVGIVTAFVGAPVLIALILRKGTR